MKVLITGFAPFGGESVNPSWEAVKLMRPPAGIELIRQEVPVVFGKAEDTVIAAVRRERPDAVVCVGQAAGRAAITPERIAINLRDSLSPDNAGRIPNEEPVVDGAPAAYFSTLPIREMQRRIEERCIASLISNTAGTFVCNGLMYSLLHFLSTEAPQIRGGFIHVPCLPEQADRMKEGTSSMPLAQIVAGLEAAISALTE